MKIGQFSRESELSPHTIRYYEKIGLLQKADKDDSGHRIYDEADLDLINWVTCLKKSGMPLQKIKRYVEAYRHNNNSEVTEILGLHLVKLKAQQVDIEHYIDVTKKKLSQLKKSN